jgi:hypothetical protein
MISFLGEQQAVGRGTTAVIFGVVVLAVLFSVGW